MLEIDWVTILWEIVNFIFITIALYYLVFKPIVKRSEARAKEKARLLSEIIQDRESAAKKLEEIEQRLANLDKEMQLITDDAYEQNKILQAKLLEATREEANQILHEALQEAHKEQFVNTKQYHNDLTDLIMRLSRDSLRKVTPPSVHASLIDGLVKNVLDMGKKQMQQVQTIRDSFLERQANAFVTSAYPLTPEQELMLVRTFNALVDKDVNLEIDLNEALIAGIKVRLGDVVIENSLGALLETIRAEIKDSLELAISENEG